MEGEQAVLREGLVSEGGGGYCGFSGAFVYIVMSSLHLE